MFQLHKFFSQEQLWVYRIKVEKTCKRRHALVHMCTIIINLVILYIIHQIRSIIDSSTIELYCFRPQCGIYKMGVLMST